MISIKNLYYEIKDMKYILLFLVLLLSLGNTTVIVNSYDGRDVIISSYYAGVIGEDVFFIPNNFFIEMITSKLKPKESEKIILINGKRMVVPDLENLLRNQGYEIEVINSDNPYELNSMLAKRVKDKTKGYVIVSPSTGYNSLSPLPFARKADYFILFADSSLEEEMSKLTEGKEVIVYGFVEDEIKQKIKGNILEIDEGDKYLDNIKMVKLYLSKFNTSQIILTDGNFLEYTLINAEYPIVFISSIIPESISSFIEEKVKNREIKVALVIGEEYISLLLIT